MFKIEFVLHENVTSNQLDEIIIIKSIAWPYSYESQLNWINSNLANKDIHVLLYLNNTLIAYLNLICIVFQINKMKKHGYGIGNVCSKEKGKGFGKEIISRINIYLIDTNKIGLLFCRDLLVPFYNQNNWKVIEKDKLTLEFDKESIETMIFNFDDEFQSIEYLGKLF